MLDEWMEQKVDEACEAVPAYVNPRKIRLASSHAGWRLYLYGSSIKRAVCGFFVHIKTADDMDLFLRETAERSDTTLNHIKRFFREKARLLAVLDDAGMRLRFVTACLLLLSAAMELGYEPICAGVRQRYLFSVAFRMLALAAPLADYFAQYRADGVTSNVVLQCAMIAMLSVHLAIFFALICFNRRQNLLLRVLSGVTGVFPALTASAAVTLAVANLAQPIGLAIAAMLRAAGTVAAFLGDRLIASGALGGIRLKYESVWEGLLLCGGLSLMLIGAWLTASPI